VALVAGERTITRPRLDAAIRRVPKLEQSFEAGDVAVSDVQRQRVAAAARVQPLGVSPSLEQRAHEVAAARVVRRAEGAREPLLRGRLDRPAHLLLGLALGYRLADALVAVLGGVSGCRRCR
jgi:hypothetical protein